MKHLLPVAALLLLSFACKRAVPGNNPGRELFDVGEKQVISVFANRQERSLSVLYGNAAAVTASLSAYTQKTAGMELCLVTYNQANNKYWYGSYINGSIKRVETIRFNPGPDSSFVYQLNQGAAPENRAGKRIGVTERVHEILAHKAVVFP